MARSTPRLTVVGGSLQLGGAERVAAFLCQCFAEAGWATSLVTLRNEADFFSSPPGVHRIRLAVEGVSSNWFAGAFANLRRAKRLRATLRALAPNLIISLQTQVNCLCLVACFGTGVPVIASDHVSPHQDPLERGPWRVLVRLLYPRAARVVVVSEGIARERAWLGQGKVVVIPNAVQLKAGGAGANDPTLHPPSAPHIIALGRLHPQKGFDLLIEAFARLAPRFPAWHVTILGEGPERPSLEARVAGLGLAGRVHLPGAAKAPAALLRAAAAGGGVFAFPSRYEGFGLTLVEAMASGLPVVAADCPHGPREILEGGAHGVLVPPENAEALAEALAALMADPARRASLAAAALARSATYAPDRIAPLWLSLADQVLAEHRRRG